MNYILKALTIGIVTLLGLNAMAADNAPLTDTSPPAVKGMKITIVERLTRMKSMTPEQRTHERELIRQELQSLSDRKSTRLNSVT